MTDGKALGTYFERKFRARLSGKYRFEAGSSALGIDFPDLNVEMKLTSVRQPQSSCPFRSAREKIYGLGYSLLVFVYDKFDDPEAAVGTLRILHAIFIESRRTGDFQTSSGILGILENNGNADDLVAFMRERNPPVDDIQALRLAEEVMENPPQPGYLTISNALQWRLQYKRVIETAGAVDGVQRIR